VSDEDDVEALERKLKRRAHAARFIYVGFVALPVVLIGYCVTRNSCSQAVTHSGHSTMRGARN
jgi:hypothetical protein